MIILDTGDEGEKEGESEREEEEEHGGKRQSRETLRRLTGTSYFTTQQ